MGDPTYQARAIAAIRSADMRRVDALDELLAMWRLDGDESEVMGLLDKSYLRDFVWTTLRTIAADPDLVAAVNNVAQILRLHENEASDCEVCGEPCGLLIDDKCFECDRGGKGLGDV